MDNNFRTESNIPTLFVFSSSYPQAVNTRNSILHINISLQLRVLFFHHSTISYFYRTRVTSKANTHSTNISKHEIKFNRKTLWATRHTKPQQTLSGRIFFFLTTNHKTFTTLTLLTQVKTMKRTTSTETNGAWVKQNPYRVLVCPSYRNIKS